MKASRADDESQAVADKTHLISLVPFSEGIHDGATLAHALGGACVEAIGKLLRQLLVLEGDGAGACEERWRNCV